MSDEAESGWYSEESATFGDRVAGARDAEGMSQEDLARRLGVKLKTVQGWEDDLAEPRANKLQMLSGILNVSLMWLLTGRGDGLPEPGEQNVLAPETRAILQEIRNLKVQLEQSTDRLGRLEKALRKQLVDDPA